MRLRRLTQETPVSDYPGGEDFKTIRREPQTKKKARTDDAKCEEGAAI